MPGQLTTHVLDTALGRPAAGVRVELWSVDGSAEAPLAVAVTNVDGRTAAPLLVDDAFQIGRYELRFHVGEYFSTHGSGHTPTVDSLYDVIPIRVVLTDLDGHYHIPLLVSPWSYTTYRGS